MPLPNEHRTPPRLLAEPELAALAVLGVALGLAQSAIVAAHPGWANCRCSTHPPSDRCAQVAMIGCMAYELQEAVNDYLHDRATADDEP